MDDLSNERQPIGVLVAGSAELVRRGIRDVFARERTFRVLGEVTRAPELAPIARRLAPDLIVVGLEPLADNAMLLDALHDAIAGSTRSHALVLTDGGSLNDLLAPVRAGARGVLLTDAPASLLLEAAHEVVAGGAALDPRLIRSLFEDWSTRQVAGDSGRQTREPAPSVLALLSPREQEVLRALARGCRNKEIALQLGVSVGTVKTHLRHIFRKLVVADRTAAVLTALDVQVSEAA